MRRAGALLGSMLLGLKTLPAPAAPRAAAAARVEAPDADADEPTPTPTPVPAWRRAKRPAATPDDGEDAVPEEIQTRRKAVARPTPTPTPTPAPPEPTLFIKEYRVDGARDLPKGVIERAVYPFLGPDRTKEDVEQARVTLENAYHAKGLQTVGVIVPEQSGANGIVHLRVVERPVGRLRVKGAKYSSPTQLKSMVPALAEGRVVDFNDVPRQIIALNQMPDRRVTPSLRAGAAPDTVDVDLDVKESLPLHAGVEVNNRRSPNTTALRVSGSLSATNLWQLGHSLGASFQISPQDTSQVKVFSGYYSLRFPGLAGFVLSAQGTKQDSNVSTLGDVAVAGKGETIGLHGAFTLPAANQFSESATVGIDYKHYEDTVTLGSTTSSSSATPITYYPLSAAYAATWLGKGQVTDVNLGVILSLRNVGNKSAQFANSRYAADSNFLIFHADASHTQDLPLGFQLFGKIQGQISDQPLISHEQASGGGLGTVRGYLEAEVVGDNAAFGSIEFRSPSLLKWWHDNKGDWRIYTFYEGGILTLRDALQDQKSHFILASYGIGTSLHLFDHFDGAVNAGVPLYRQADTAPKEVRVIFRAALDF